MKKWNAAELVVLGMEKTENGIFNAHHETVIIHNDSKKSEYPNDSDETVDRLS